MNPKTLICKAMGKCASFDCSMMAVIQTMDDVCETESDPYISVLDGQVLWYFYPRAKEIIPKPLGFEPTCRISLPKYASEKPILIGSSYHNKINWALKELKEVL